MSPKLCTPSATLVPVTPEAQAAIQHREEIHISTFPFKIGRESRLRAIDRLKSEVERRLGGAPPSNDLYLLELSGDLLHLSREHFLIDYRDDRFSLVDRRSACGTVVSGRTIGGTAEEHCVELLHGDTIIVGTEDSPYVFQFRVL
jgi:hypothetical protein